MNIMIDPGHGGGNRGCKIGKIDESQYTLEFAAMLQKEFENIEGVNPYMTRHYDVDRSFHVRNNEALRLDCGLVLSIHVNAGDSGLHGASCFIWPGNRKTRKICETIMAHAPECLLGNAQRIVETDKKEWKKRVRRVVSAFSVDTILLEIGFATNKKDRKALFDEKVKLEMINAISEGISLAMEIL